MGLGSGLGGGPKTRKWALSEGACLGRAQAPDREGRSNPELSMWRPPECRGVFANYAIEIGEMGRRRNQRTGQKMARGLAFVTDLGCHLGEPHVWCRLAEGGRRAPTPASPCHSIQPPTRQDSGARMSSMLSAWVGRAVGGTWPAGLGEGWGRAGGYKHK